VSSDVSLVARRESGYQAGCLKTKSRAFLRNAFRMSVGSLKPNGDVVYVCSSEAILDGNPLRWGQP
jgi:hypothetical protein